MTNRVLLFLALILVALGGWFGISMYRGATTGAPRSALSHREVATRVLAEHLVTQYPGKPVLVVSNPFTREKRRNPQIYAYEQAGLDGLRAGLGKAVPMKVGFPALRPEARQNPGSVYVDPETTTPLSFLMAENAFDSLSKEHPDSEIFVSLIGLPANFRRLELSQSPAGPKLALLLPDWRCVGDKAAVRAAFQSEKIIAAVINKPGAPPESTPPANDYKAEFESRFLLVTKKNVDQLLEAFPQLF